MKILLKISKTWTIVICLLFMFIPMYFGMIIGIDENGSFFQSILGILIATIGYMIAILILMYRRKHGIKD